MRKHTTKHHRNPRSLGGSNDKKNISEIPANMHQAWHLLFVNFTPERIAEVINAVYLDPDWEFIARKREGGK